MLMLNEPQNAHLVQNTGDQLSSTLPIPAAIVHVIDAFCIV